MSNYALLTPEAQEILESDRKSALKNKLERIDQLQKEVAFAAIVGIARKAIILHPEVRYVEITRPGSAKDLRLLKVSEVLDENRQRISGSQVGRGICWDIEDLLQHNHVHNHPGVEPGEYDFVVLASKQF